VSWFGSEPRGLVRPNPLVTAAVVVVAGLAAVILAWISQGAVERWATRAVAARAVGQLEARVLADVDVVDLEAPRPGESSTLTEQIDARLGRLQSMPGFDVVRVNIYAPDGAVLSSGQAERIGRKVLPGRVPRLAGALAGTVNTRLLALSPEDDADLAERYPDVLAIYAPITRCRCGWRGSRPGSGSSGRLCWRSSSTSGCAWSSKRTSSSG
jgi:hypothetical protein